MSADLRQHLPRELWPIADWCDHVSAFSMVDTRLPGTRVLDAVEAAQVYLREHPAATAQLLAVLSATHPAVLERFRGAAVRGTAHYITVVPALDPASRDRAQKMVDRAEAEAIATSTPRAAATEPPTQHTAVTPPLVVGLAGACGLGLAIITLVAWLLARLCA